MVDVLRNGGPRAVAPRQTPLVCLDGNGYLTCQAERAGIFITSAELDSIAGVECLDVCGAYRLNKHRSWAERVMQFSTHTLTCICRTMSLIHILFAVNIASLIYLISHCKISMLR